VVTAGLNLAEPEIPVQVTAAVVALTGDVLAEAIPPVAAIKPMGMAVAAATNSNLRIMCVSFSPVSPRIDEVERRCAPDAIALPAVGALNQTSDLEPL
jgi:hypothetical protein